MTKLKASSVWPGHVLSDLACQSLFLPFSAKSQVCDDVTLLALEHTPWMSRFRVVIGLCITACLLLCTFMQKIGMCATNTLATCFMHVHGDFAEYSQQIDAAHSAGFGVRLNAFLCNVCAAHCTTHVHHECSLAANTSKVSSKHVECRPQRQAAACCLHGSYPLQHSEDVYLGLFE